MGVISVVVLRGVQNLAAREKEKGQIRLEGKDYVMQDEDVTFFRFNV